jgi:hypothetical protein
VNANSNQTAASNGSFTTNSVVVQKHGSGAQVHVGINHNGNFDPSSDLVLRATSAHKLVG